jgi:hypothetical protein
VCHITRPVGSAHAEAALLFLHFFFFLSSSMQQQHTQWVMANCCAAALCEIALFVIDNDIKKGVATLTIYPPCAQCKRRQKDYFIYMLRCGARRCTLRKCCHFHCHAIKWRVVGLNGKRGHSRDNIDSNQIDFAYLRAIFSDSFTLHYYT